MLLEQIDHIDLKKSVVVSKLIFIILSCKVGLILHVPHVSRLYILKIYCDYKCRVKAYCFHILGQYMIISQVTDCVPKTTGIK